MTTNSIKTEKGLDGFQIYSWFNREFAFEETKYYPTIKVYSKGTTSEPNQDQRIKFKTECSRILNLFFRKKINFFVIRFSVTHGDLTRTEKAKGIWGNLRSSLDKKLSFKDEVEIQNRDSLLRAGSAKISHLGIYEAISILEEDPSLNFIITAEFELTRDHLIQIAQAFANSNNIIQIFPLVLYAITNFSGFIRWGDSSEEICLDYI